MAIEKKNILNNIVFNGETVKWAVNELPKLSFHSIAVF